MSTSTTIGADGSVRITDTGALIGHLARARARRAAGIGLSWEATPVGAATPVSHPTRAAAIDYLLALWRLRRAEALHATETTTMRKGA